MMLSKTVPWLSLNPESTTINAGETAIIEMSFDTWDMVEGSYFCNIIVTDNTNNIVTIPVSLIVDEAVGMIDLDNNNDDVIVYPNPFTDKTIIYFSLKKTQNVQLDIFNMNGEKVISLIDNDELNKGSHSFIWNGNNGQNTILPDGIYMYSLTTDSKYTGKIILKR